MSEDMSPHCSAHDEWLIMKPCMYMYLGYHTANNVSNFGGDLADQSNLKNVLKMSLQIYSDGLPYCCSQNNQPFIMHRAMW